MNPRAVHETDDRFYRLHPELTDSTGHRTPLTMSPADRALRREWTAINRQVSADPRFAACPAGGVVAGCPLAAPVAPPPPPAAVVAPPPAAVVPPPSCKVEVGASLLGSLPFGGSYYHLFVLYTDASGTVTYYRGGPSGGGFSAPSQASGGSSEHGSGESSGSGSNPSGGPSESSGPSSSSSDSSGSPEDGGGSFGYIYVEHGEYLPGTIDYEPSPPRVTIEEGASTCGAGARLETAFAAVGSSRTPYRPLGPNSNSTVYTALRSAGFTPQVPSGVWAPGKDDPISGAGGP